MCSSDLKVARSVVVSGLATSAAISNVSEDTTPQLGGNLDMNGAEIGRASCRERV